MDLMRKRKDSRTHLKKDKKLKKLISKSDSDSDESEHELSYYLNDRIKLMKEVLKIIKPKKIKTMAPSSIKNLDNKEINSMLLEELLGISNKRLKYIFNGQILEEDSSSTDPEAEQKPIDVISLDDISDDDFVIDLDSDNDEKNKCRKKHGKFKIKEECRRKKIKREKQDKADHSGPSKKSKEPGKGKMDEQNLMTVLELLELQARARAIKSQLVLESSKKTLEQEESEVNNTRAQSDHDDAIIIESPKNIEIIITSSESETEGFTRNSSRKQKDSSKKADLYSKNGNDEARLKKDGVTESEDAAKETSYSTGELNTEQVENAVEDCVTAEIENNNEQNEPGQTSKAKESEVENPGEYNDVKSGSKSSEDEKHKSKNKIINIETIIISPAKISTVPSNVEKDEQIKKSTEKIKNNSGKEKYNDNISEKGNEKIGNNSEKDKSNDNDSEKTKTKSRKSKNEVQNDYTKPENYQAETSTADEGDGIIINLEQSEIDCIISD